MSVGIKLNYSIRRFTDDSVDVSDLKSNLSDFQIEKLTFLFKCFNQTNTGYIEVLTITSLSLTNTDLWSLFVRRKISRRSMSCSGTSLGGRRTTWTTSPCWTTTACSWSVSWARSRVRGPRWRSISPGSRPEDPARSLWPASVSRTGSTCGPSFSWGEQSTKYLGLEIVVVCRQSSIRLVPQLKLLTSLSILALVKYIILR